MEIEKSRKYRRGNLSVTGWSARGAMVLALTVVLLAGCGGRREETTVQERRTVTPENVAENTNRYIGQVVTVRGQPIDKIGTDTFTIEDRKFFGNKPVLVVNATGKTFVYPTDGTDIQATGEVRNFVTSEVARQYNLGLDTNAYVKYENQPALIARSLAVSPKPGDLTRDPGRYYGKPLAVTGQVKDVSGTNAFTLSENRLFGGQDLLVLRAKGETAGSTANQPAVQNGESVAVTGVLRPFSVADLQREYNLNLDAATRQRLETRYANKPVLIAEGVYPSAIPDDNR
ncbi:hypothetical protein V0288_12380 [Pannus brasiliensis CCIBt3594]|uniref:Uncharacterized protein n=1 Tax=Pannus brasiliensis CCIBt3594 TaxID=1427578 RepID=A0AAW9QWR8_9CHRO